METSVALMDVIRLDGPCEIDEMVVSQLPIPQVKEGWLRVRVAAFGINESESHSRRGLSDPDFTYPRVLGIEGVGVVDEVAPRQRFHARPAGCLHDGRHGPGVRRLLRTLYPDP